MPDAAGYRCFLVRGRRTTRAKETLPASSAQTEELLAAYFGAAERISFPSLADSRGLLPIVDYRAEQTTSFRRAWTPPRSSREARIVPENDLRLFLSFTLSDPFVP